MRIRHAKPSDIPLLDSIFGEKTQYNKKRGQWERYLEEQSNNKRIMVLAVSKGEILGYANLRTPSIYPLFIKQNIPEISDLNVCEEYRRNGYARRMINYLIRHAKEMRYTKIGIGVGLYSDYGAAQRLYIKMGFIPDGEGITSHNKQVIPGKNVFVDDDLVLWFTRNI